LLFRAQPDDPHRLIIKPLSLQCHPQYLWFNDTLLAYLSSYEPQTTSVKVVHFTPVSRFI